MYTRILQNHLSRALEGCGLRTLRMTGLPTHAGLSFLRCEDLLRSRRGLKVCNRGLKVYV